MRSGGALGVACIDQNTVAVTSVSDKFIQLVYLDIGRPVKFINTNTACSGITLTNGMLVFCSIGKGLRKVYLKDESIVEIVDFDANLCSRVTSFNDKLYYTDSNRSEVGCCDINGTTLWTFTDTSVSKDQRSIAVDDYGNVYVVDPRSANVIVISPDGKKHKQLLSKTERLDNPWALQYDWKTRQLLVANSTESQLTYTTNRQKNISTCPNIVVILNIAPKVFRIAKLSESAPMNKLPKNGLGN